MARTRSTMLELGTPAPDFSLFNFNPPGPRPVMLSDFRNRRGILVAFICNHCPYVIHILHSFATFAADYENRDIAVIAINANDISTHPDDSPEQMTHIANEYGLSFPYLFDADQSAARAYQAACTPDFFLFNAGLQLYYRGQYDNARPGNGQPVTGKDLGAATELLLAGKPAPQHQLPSMGCNIKWQPGQEPDYT
ncbi:MAG TPA: thioredoxin family protein [Gammaproteobacteria bacterium]|nr:thioredoxin family protein [Gammaproteobacteria bacterium]